MIKCVFSSRTRILLATLFYWYNEVIGKIIRFDIKNIINYVGNKVEAKFNSTQKHTRKLAVGLSTLYLDALYLYSRVEVYGRRSIHMTPHYFVRHKLTFFALLLSMHRVGRVLSFFSRVCNLRRFFVLLPRVHTSFTRGIPVVAHFPHLEQICNYLV